MTTIERDIPMTEDITLDGHGRRFTIRSLREAMLILSSHWPVDGGEAHRTALQALKKVLDMDASGQADRRLAIASVVRAAEEAGFKIPSRQERPAASADNQNDPSADRDVWVRERAHVLWVEDDRPDGRQERYLARAVEEWERIGRPPNQSLDQDEAAGGPLKPGEKAERGDI